jgi:hypothetical protein
MKAYTLLSLVGLFVAPVVSQAVVIDDFSDADLSEYTLTRVSEGSGATSDVSNISFSQSTGSLAASYSGTSAVEQVVFLRSDQSLSVGSILTVDVNFAVQASTMDFGIAVAATTPTGSTSGDLDTRDTASWAAVYVRPSQDAVRSTFANSTAPVTGTGVLTAVETSVGRLFIRRNTATQFDLGYFNTSGVETISSSVTFTATNVGAQVGFYADLRASGGTLGSLDNLSISAIPEPSTYAAIAGLAILGTAVLKRRRR